MVLNEDGYQDHVEWVDMVAKEIMKVFEAVMQRKPNAREIGDLLGSFLLAMVRAQEGKDVPRT